ncbi:MAG: anaerobic sulfite reductase subunit AsrA [Victivallaceae bacterium]|jgi:anaerobic sulfite reductase subunit A
MGKEYTIAEFNRILDGLAHKYRLIGPVRREGQGAFSDTDAVGYGEFASAEQLILHEKSCFSPKEFIFPIRETLFRFNGARTEVPEDDNRDMILFLRPCDINGIKRLDAIFINNGGETDFYYQRLRKKVRFFMIECREGFDSCFCVSMNSSRTEDYSCALRFSDDTVSAEVCGREFADAFSGGAEVPFTPEFVQENRVRVNVPPPEKINYPALFEHPLWKEYTSRCIACGRCNTSCVTCSCFTMQDVQYDRNRMLAERRRVWAGCHINGFTDMAGGHSFRSKNGDRMRFKTMHKINDFYRRFGFHMCVGCGRCDDVCPEYISFAGCINKLDQIVREMSNDK